MYSNTNLVSQCWCVGIDKFYCILIFTVYLLTPETFHCRSYFYSWWQQNILWWPCQFWENGERTLQLADNSSVDTLESSFFVGDQCSGMSWAPLPINLRSATFNKITSFNVNATNQLPTKFQPHKPVKFWQSMNIGPHEWVYSNS